MPAKKESKKTLPPESTEDTRCMPKRLDLTVSLEVQEKDSQSLLVMMDFVSQTGSLERVDLGLLDNWDQQETPDVPQ